MPDYTDKAALRLLSPAGKVDVTERLGAVTVALSTSETSQVTAEVLDPEGELFLGPLFRDGKTELVFDDLRYRVAAREWGSGTDHPRLKLTGRPTGIRALREREGARTWQGVSPDAVVIEEARSVGLRVLAEPRPKRRQIIRKAEANTDPESSWALMARLAEEEGAILFEAVGTVYFGRPSWLVGKLPRGVVTWAPNGGGTEHLHGAPAIRDSEDDPKAAAEVTLTMEGRAACQLTPGTAVDLRGVGRYSRLYLVTAFSFTVGAKTGEVSLVAPVDPEAKGQEA